MKTVAFVAALAGFAAAAPQAVTSAVAPQESAPAGCKSSYDGQFQLVVESAGAKKVKRDSTPLEVKLQNGVMTDAQGRTGYIASNNQFQFDGPAQAGAIYTAGWSVCGNGSIALGNSAVFYQCLSGSFYNLYDESTADQCSPVYLVALGSQTTATAAATHTVMCQIGDGQVQQNTCVTTATAVAEATDGQLTAAKATITQISDGQIQAPTGAVVSQISDGQPQAPTATGAVISQISDGQPQAPTATSAVSPVTNAASSAAAVTGAPVSQISDGQIQVPTNGTVVTSPAATGAQAAASSPASFTGAGVVAMPQLGAGLLAAVAAVAIAAL